ncbi:hypothetical protein V5799_014645 [Amblyomma americanum]|uniref:Uncharacterized protein n=1 Tax=Amblyomma americanum TaxID=6943 RepID=A0AAQ4E2E8_AMBAM
MATGPGAAPDLVRCRNLAVLLEALESRDTDDDVQYAFYWPSCERLDLLRWVLVSIDPSGATERYLCSTGDVEEVRERVLGVLTQIKHFSAEHYAEFVYGLALPAVQKPLWIHLMKTAERAQNELLQQQPER